MPNGKAQQSVEKMPASSNGKPRRHRGDFLSPEVRSAVMARIRGKDTGPERTIIALLKARGHQFESHAKDLPGRPDIVFRQWRIAVFIDGDFWHGWRFPLWRDKLSEEWERKIELNRLRDARNHRRLRARGWRVIRLWEHQIKADAEACADRISTAVAAASWYSR